MRVVATEYVTPDGVLEEPGKWSFPFFPDAVRKFKFDELFASDALLLGRKTYEGSLADNDRRDGLCRQDEWPAKVRRVEDAQEARLEQLEADQRTRCEEIAKWRKEPGHDLLL